MTDDSSSRGDSLVNIHSRQDRKHIFFNDILRKFSKLIFISRCECVCASSSVYTRDSDPPCGLVYSRILSISQASHLEYTRLGFGVVVLSLGRILRASYTERNGIYMLNTSCNAYQCRNLPSLSSILRCFDMCDVLITFCVLIVRDV